MFITVIIQACPQKDNYGCRRGAVTANHRPSVKAINRCPARPDSFASPGQLTAHMPRHNPINRMEIALEQEVRAHYWQVNSLLKFKAH